MNEFKIKSKFKPTGDQPQAIKKLVAGYKKYPEQTLLGVTGSGKTFTVANVIAQTQKPALVLSHNKTLASQLYQEFKTFFPENKVCYFVSYYDYYQPESYLPSSDTYIEKDAMVNEKIEQLRLEAAQALLTRKDVIVVSSVSCIYAFGKPQDYQNQSLYLKVGQKINREAILSSLIDIQYERNDMDLKPGMVRGRGETIDIFPGSSDSLVIRVIFEKEKIEKIAEVEPITGRVIKNLNEAWIYPARPYVVPPELIKPALESIREELNKRLPELDVVEAYRLKQRTNYDMEMIEQMGYCKGMENYSRHFDGRKAGQPPFTLMDFFNYSYKDDWLLLVDESHQTLPQVRGMYHGDFARKKNLVDYGFRLPSAFDNRPLKFQEFRKYLKHVIYTSATPDEYELERSSQVVEQIIRPTGLVDPEVIIKPIKGQIEDLMAEIKKTTADGYRTLVTTLTKRMSEDLSSFLNEKGIKTVYLHSEIDTLERVEIIKKLRLGQYDVLVGINLLREGLDLPEVALVAILDADKEGFLRNTTSLIQTAGRAARNVNSKVIMYADVMTKSIKQAMAETERRRKIQLAYNKKNKITPVSISKAIAKEEVVFEPKETGQEFKIDKLILDLEGQMKAAAENLDFEKAIELREKVDDLKKKLKDI